MLNVANKMTGLNDFRVRVSTLLLRIAMEIEIHVGCDKLYFYSSH